MKHLFKTNKQIVPCGSEMRPDNIHTNVCPQLPDWRAASVVSREADPWDVGLAVLERRVGWQPYLSWELRAKYNPSPADLRPVSGCLPWATASSDVLQSLHQHDPEGRRDGPRSAGFQHVEHRCWRAGLWGSPSGMSVNNICVQDKHIFPLSEVKNRTGLIISTTKLHWKTSWNTLRIR